MEIIYQDREIVVCLKPAGVLSTDEPGGVPELLRQQLQTAAKLKKNMVSESADTVAAFDRPAALTGGDVIKQVMGWIRAHCAEPIRISDLVRISGYSRTRLFALFAAEAGLSPNDFLLRCRIARAKELLRAGAAPLTQVALDCGFSSSTYFSTTFRKYTGKPPREFITSCRS